MAEYGKIYKRVWTTSRFKSMSRDSRLLLNYTWSSEHTNSVGIYRLPKAYIMEDLGYTQKELSRALDEIIKNQWVKYDETVSVILVYKWFTGTPPAHSIQNDNQFKKVSADIDEIPRTELIRDLLKEVEGGVKGIPDRYLQLFIKRLEERLPNGSETVPKPFRNIGTGTGAGAGTGTGAQSGKPDIPFAKILEHLNSLTGFNYKIDPPSSLSKKHITARWNDGFQLHDFLYVNEVKTAEWLKTPRHKYLRPETLYGNKFEGYRQQSKKTQDGDQLSLAGGHAEAGPIQG